MSNFFWGIDVDVISLLYSGRNLTFVIWLIRLTELGSAVAIGGLALLLALVLGFKRQWNYAAGLCVTIAGGAAAEYLLKELFHRARPDLYFQAYWENGYSFPSGHATFSMMFYGFCIFLVYRLMPFRVWRAVVMTFLALLILAIGFSRLYLGVHFISDVLAGYALGGIFLTLGVWTVRRLETRAGASATQRQGSF